VRAERIDRGDFEKYLARLIFRTSEAEGIHVLRSAGVVDMHGRLRENGDEKNQEEARLHKILTVQ
jgi:hypothetical protein